MTHYSLESIAERPMSNVLKEPLFKKKKKLIAFSACTYLVYKYNTIALRIII